MLKPKQASLLTDEELFASTVPRHKWIRLREHHYICRVCGTIKRNETEGGSWMTEFDRPTGELWPGRHVPPCLVGPDTTARLTEHAAIIAAGGVPKVQKGRIDGKPE